MFLILIGRVHSGLKPHRIALTEEAAIAWLQQNGYTKNEKAMTDDVWHIKSDPFAHARIDFIPSVED
jgi:hypothetical protein